MSSQRHPVITDLQSLYKNCALCPRMCGIDRTKRRGVCGCTAMLTAARAALHFWEEPCISGTRGSGTVFFSGCTLKCCFCQNYPISQEGVGKVISIKDLAHIFLDLQSQGAHNISLVTADHYLPSVLEALDLVKHKLTLPVVYNCSGYERPEILRLLDGYVDIYLPDLKYLDPELAQKFSYAPDYVQAAKAAIGEMVRQTGKCEFGEDGYIRKGTIVRHLILPGHTGNSIKAMSYLHETYGEDIYISIMNQYTPVRKFVEFKELNRKVTKREYEKVLDAAVDMGIQNGFIQEGETASESFIPDFDYEGVEKNTP